VLASQGTADRRDINPLLKICQRISAAMPQAISIDNFIDCHAKEPLLATCGKVAIAKAILAAEARSSLMIDRSNYYNKLDFKGNELTWFNSFFQLLTENCNLEDLPERLKRIAVVSFNYDRCFEHYLFNAIQNYYSVDSTKCAEMLKNLEIHHPYGMVGSLPWMQSNASIEFGGELHSANQLVSVAEQLRTFTEGTDPKVSNINAIHSSIRSAEKIMFLGFAYHRLNMDLIFSGNPVLKTDKVKRVFGTAFGVSKNDCEVICSEIAAITGCYESRLQVRNDLTCSGLLQAYWRSLSIV
jgi:hypothetical protein